MQLRKGLVVIALLFFSVALGAGLAQANLFSNSSFESPVVTAGTYGLVSNGQTTIPGWSVAGASGNVAVTSCAYLHPVRVCIPGTGRVSVVGFDRGLQYGDRGSTRRIDNGRNHL